jgi:hypothetical protein
MANQCRTGVFEYKLHTDKLREKESERVIYIYRERERGKKEKYREREEREREQSPGTRRNSTAAGKKYPF